MGLYDLLKRLTDTLEQLGINYLATGSVATIAYGEPRMTVDIDVVVELKLEDVDKLCAAFPAQEYYVSPESARDAVTQRFQFNIIHNASGFKADVIIPKDTPFERSRQKRGRRVRLRPDLEVTFASPEDVIVRKMEYYKEGESSKHLRDIAGVLKVQGSKIDRDYIKHWASQLGVAKVWEQILEEHAKQS
jgi:hypothetical protein